jgi:molybdopterin-guanine dinucleotide biosynthesis protein A
MTFSGFVLTGGGSTRMGTDKALLPVGGVPMVVIVAGALRRAGAREVVAVGGDRHGLEQVGLSWVADRWPGEGPLGGLITALEAATSEVVAVLACDLADVTETAIRQVVEAVDDAAADAAVAEAGGRRHPLLAAYRRRSQARLRTAFDGGVRAVGDALESLTVASVALDDPGWARNVNRPDDVPMKIGRTTRNQGSGR